MVKVSKGEREQRCRSKMQTAEMMQMFHSSLRNLTDHSEVRMEKKDEVNEFKISSFSCKVFDFRN